MEEKLLKAVNEQINKELESAYIYFAMSAQCENMRLRGFANWLKVQAQEEIKHAMKFYQHLIDRNQKVELIDIKAPKKEFTNLTEIFKAAYEHEKYITKSIHELQDVAEEVKDKDIISLIDWFNTEQIEEEKSTSDVLHKLEFSKEQPSAIFALDSQLTKREDD